MPLSMVSVAGSAGGADCRFALGDTLLSTELASGSRLGFTCQRLGTAVYACVCELRRLVSRWRVAHQWHGACPRLDLPARRRGRCRGQTRHCHCSCVRRHGSWDLLRHSPSCSGCGSVDSVVKSASPCHRRTAPYWGHCCPMSRPTPSWWLRRRPADRCGRVTDRSNVSCCKHLKMDVALIILVMCYEQLIATPDGVHGGCAAVGDWLSSVVYKAFRSFAEFSGIGGTRCCTSTEKTFARS
jgi:hypothetical protein